MPSQEVAMPLSHGRSIRQFFLTRDISDNEPMWLDDMMGYMGIDNPDRNLWQSLCIKWGARDVAWYSVSIPNFAYIVHAVNMDILPEPRMKHRDMIVDNYKAAGGDLATLQRIGVTYINHAEAYDCIEAAFISRSLGFPDMGYSIGWDELVVDNPFLEGQISMLKEYSEEFNNARIGRVTIAAHGLYVSRNTHLVHMVTHLTRDMSVIQAPPVGSPAPDPRASFRLRPLELNIGNFDNSRRCNGVH
ncbi:hypothetical protein F5Y00DRAFT_262292 [Daldinia vernicosa]|uniref:uncharacterized protein n=1 Tax=Daldinia vernicosa TaxID=114800 RepID=UPI002007804B|nr:uncharacterized protein F5Y00DRAFT_262292 [Daldinia vernicosa]KAI0848820.1 hypothetical protein F5Y00DRAFT_262292 [Daldinia vernicosa]